MRNRYREINSFFNPILNKDEGFIWEYPSWFPQTVYGFDEGENTSKMKVSKIFQQLSNSEETLNLKGMQRV